MRTIYLECNMGAAGDMLMAALYELCEQQQLFLDSMDHIFEPFGITVEAEPDSKCGICGTHINILVHGTEEGAETPSDHADETDGTHAHTTYHSVLDQLSMLTLPDQVREDAAAVYRLIGEAEAKVHNTALEQIHFHEVGTLDALADVVGCSLLFYMLAPDQVLCSPIHVGTGYIKCAHGILPVPAPATAEILKGVPCYSGSITGELCTPTGAALLKYFVTKFTPMPTITAETIGYGMGTKNFPIANCLRATLGQTFGDETKTSAKQEPGFPGDDAVLSISTNIDDMTGEAMGLATEILMTAGALDVYTIPVQMKKNRPGILLTCLCKPEEKDKFTGLLFLHTSTRGVRYQTYSRAKLESTFETRSTSYGDIRVKKSTGYGVKKEKAEFEDLKDVVLKNNCELSAEDIRKKLISEGSRKKGKH